MAIDGTPATKPANTTSSVEELTKQLEVSNQRFKDTQAAYTKSRQDLATLTATNEVLETQIGNNATVIAPDVQKELDGLKISDPDEWFRRLTAMQNDKTTELNTLRQGAIDKGNTESILIERENQLVAFNILNPETPLTLESLNGDIPPRIANKLEKKEISFVDYLKEAHEYLQAGTSVNTETTNTGPDLNNAAGGSSANPGEQKEEAKSYEETTY